MLTIRTSAGCLLPPPISAHMRYLAGRVHQPHDRIGSFLCQFGVMDEDPHLGVDELGPRIGIH
jgi:hypothetical protein